MSHVCTPILVGVTSPVSEILLLFYILFCMTFAIIFPLQVHAQFSLFYTPDRGAQYCVDLLLQGGHSEIKTLFQRGVTVATGEAYLTPPTRGGLEASRPEGRGWSYINIPSNNYISPSLPPYLTLLQFPYIHSFLFLSLSLSSDKEKMITDSHKMVVLDKLLTKLKREGHRVLVYSQMTRMIDLLEEFMSYRHHKYIRLDGSSRISDRRDMVADFQTKSDIFVFLLSTRAGGLGINLTAADTVIFYDSDWNPTVDQQVGVA